MDWKKLVMNALLAGFWAGLASLQVSSELSKAAVWAAGAAALRASVGVIANAMGKPVPVDES